MFDDYEKQRWKMIKAKRAEVMEALAIVDEYLTEGGLDKDEWNDAYRFIDAACRILNHLEKIVLVVRCRRLDENAYRAATGSSKRK